MGRRAQDIDPRDLPDVRDGLTRVERVVLTVLRELQDELGDRRVPTAMLYGRVAERLDLGVPDFQRVLERLVGEVDAAMTPPPEGTVERWAWDYVLATEIRHKIDPPPPPARWEEAPPRRRLERPGRPAGLELLAHSPRTPSAGALRNPVRRAQLVHTFFHHELQAAELMAWAVLAFPETPRAFRAGLLGVLGDEIRHMNQYAAYLGALGHAFGDFPVRDWFWERVPSAPSATHFVAVLGIGFEGGNLDHAARFAERLRAAGDDEGARLQERIGAEEVAHVRFALRWFARWTGGADFAAWSAHLPEPLSPMVMRGRPLAEGPRLRAGFPPAFLEALEAWAPT